MDVLIVEDNPNDVLFIRHALSKQGRISHIEVVQDGQSALDFLFNRGEYAHRTDHTQPELILLDLRLPKVWGMEVLRILKSESATQAIPVIVMSSLTDDSNMLTAYELGANGFICKSENFIALVQSAAFYWLRVKRQAITSN